ncbi:MAG TPA: hypothetical protein VJ729_06900 [Nitrososphaeraceae archaeon]|nr:hypothetical protein [Nitrososphaeraceae archaeon]
MHRYYYYSNLAILIVAMIVASSSLPALSIKEDGTGTEASRLRAPIATSSDNNVYVTWWSNKTGNDEVMFKASTDGGKTFSDKMNLSNTPKSDSQDAEIAASGNNVYVTWWGRNATSNEPVLRVSNDNGKTFGEKIMLSEK